MENLEIVKEMYDAVAKGDFPAFLGAMDEAIEWNEAENFPYADRNPYIGPQAVAEGVLAALVPTGNIGHYLILNFMKQKMT